MGWKFNPFTGTLDITGNSGGGGSPGGNQYDVQLNDGAGGFSGSDNLNFQDGYLTINGDSGYGQLQWLNSPITGGYGGSGINGINNEIIAGALAGDLSIWSSQGMSFSSDTGSTNMLQINGNGSINLGHYGSGTFTGTPTYTLQADSSGNIIEGSLGGTGTVTTVSVVSANGISGSVANPTTTPAITLTLGAITPTSVNSVVLSGSSTPALAVTGTSSISGSNTGDQTTSGTSNRISVSNGSTNPTIDISASYVGQSSVTTLGTIGTGVWQGTKIGLAYGGTNADLSGTGGTSQVLKQVSSGAAITVGQLAASDLSNGTTGSGSIVLATSPTMSNPVVGTQSAADNSTKGASTAYVTSAISTAIAGVNPAVAVSAATTSASNTSGLTYNNGASGIGATFTGSTNTALTVDGFTFTTLGQRLLVKNDTQSPSGAFNGVYYVTQVQTSLLPPILTRALDYDQPSDINSTGAIPVISGTLNAGTSWLLTSSVTTVGTDPLTYTQFTINPSTIFSFVWNNVTGTSQSAAVNNGYITNNASLVTVTLPSTASIGNIVRIAGSGAGGWKLAQNASQLVNFGTSVTTTGTGGSLASANRYDAVEVICIVANTTWVVISSQGNLTVT